MARAVANIARFFRTKQHFTPLWGAVAACAALPGLLVLWGFTVDDALISARVAENLAQGFGYRFNREGPISDAVTPLGWAQLLSLLAGEGCWQTLERARIAGAAAGLVAAGLLGIRLAQLPIAAIGAGVLTLAASLPLAAWAVSGMETPFVTLLVTLSLFRTRGAAMAAGCAAALRPELLPWAAVSAWFGAFPAPCRSFPERVVHLSSVLAPAALVAGIRWVAFGSPIPLAAVAKPSDFAHGLNYAAVGLLLSGPWPLLLASPKIYARLSQRTRALGYALVAQLLSVVLAGGDWMSFFRLLVPVLPVVITLGAELWAQSVAWANAGRLALVVASSSVLWTYKADEARGVAQARLALIESAREPLARARAVAAVDVGWVGAATDAQVVDLAGVTDPVIAPMPGGHTTKRVPSALLIKRGVDTLVLLLADGETLQTPWYASRFYYGVDRLLASAMRDLDFRPHKVLPLGGTPKSYVILTNRSP